MKYYRGIYELQPDSKNALSTMRYVKTGTKSIGVYGEKVVNRHYENLDGANIMNMKHLYDDIKDHAGQNVLFTIDTRSPSHFDHNTTAAENLWTVPSLVNGEQLIELSKAWNGWTKPGDPTGLGDNPFGLGSAIKLLNLVVIEEEDRSSYGDKKSTFVFRRFNLLVDMETTTEEEILRVLGKYYSQDPKEFHIGEKSLGHPDNPVPAGMQGYTYRSNAGLLIVGADKFIYHPKKAILQGDGSEIPVDRKTTLTGEVVFRSSLNPMNLAMNGKNTYPILEKKTPMGKQKVNIDESGCLITRIAPYISNVPRGSWFY